MSNNPISIAVPAKRQRPLLLNMATSVAAGSRILVARDTAFPFLKIGRWALDGDGNATTDSHMAMILLLFGGPIGSGLALMFETLSSIIANDPLVSPVLVDSQERRHQDSVVAATNISTFTDVETYKKDVDKLVDCLKSLPKADGFDETLMPGEPENRCYDERIENGIPLLYATLRNLRDLAEQFGIEFPVGGWVQVSI